MDPASVMSLTGACLTILVRTVREINELVGKMSNMEQKVNLIVARLNTISATMSQLELWMRTHDVSRIAEDLAGAIRSCTLVVGEIESYVKSVKGGWLSGRIRYLWDEGQFLQYQSALDSQVAALGLFLNVILLNSNTQRQVILESSASRRALQEARDQASICSNGARRRARAGSIQESSGSSSITATTTTTASSNSRDDGGRSEESFAFDNELIDSETYRAAFRRMMALSPTTQRDPGAPEESEQGTKKSKKKVRIGSESSADSSTTGSSPWSRRRSTLSSRSSWSMRSSMSSSSSSSNSARELCLAASRGDVQEVEKLLAGNPPVDANARCKLDADEKQHGIKGRVFLPASSKLERTAMHHAAANGHAEVVLLLARHGAHVAARTKHGKMPLHVARSAAVAALLSLGADPLCRDDVSATPLHHLATASCSPEASDDGAAAISALITTDPLTIDATNKRRQTPLHLASQHNNTAVASALIAARAYVDAADTDGLRPLHYAAEHGHPAIIHLLLSAQADPEAPAGKDMWRPLHHAAHRGHADAIAALLAPPPPSSAASPSSPLSPLVASPLSRAATLALAPSSGSGGGAAATVDAPAADQRRPLHLAISANAPAAVAALLTAGADVEAPTSTSTSTSTRRGSSSNETPLQLALARLQQQDAKSSSVIEIIHHLLHHNASPTRVPGLLATACAAPAPAPVVLDVVRALLAHGADPNGGGGTAATGGSSSSSVDESTPTPLSAACARPADALDVVRLLVAHGATPRHQDFCAAWRNGRLRTWEKRALHAAMGEVAGAELRRDEVEWLIVSR
ncbi:Ankyrin-3 [Lasiodiplodia hormozganensis]|uniref:Ankyrin-3 n=1 Tax=Lasiodiplodia hormozganensis TaxID=869390 RepID=A0AA40CGX5_9PEZI|nr:Ankyrin-3 [Lasiodiplodia hormozganensis]